MPNIFFYLFLNHLRTLLLYKNNDLLQIKYNLPIVFIKNVTTISFLQTLLFGH